MPPRIRAPSVSASLSAPLADLASRQQQQLPFARTFTSTPCVARLSKARQGMIKWLETAESEKLANAQGPTYIGPHADQPFPNNPLFRSQTVLSDFSRDLIYEKVVKRGDTLKAVSAEFGVDIRRVAAVVRLKQLEKQASSQVSCLHA
jgi:predicted component of type VI protein secretion system